MRLTSIGIVSMVVIGILPFLPRLSLFYGAVSAKALFVVIAIATVALLSVPLILKESKRTSLKKRPFTIAIIGVLLAHLISSAAGVFFEHSLWADVLRSTGVLFLLHLAAWAYLMGKFFTENDWTVFRRTIIISAGIFSFLSILGIGGLGYSAHILWLDLGQLGISFGNDTYAGIYLVLAFLIGCMELVRNNSVLWRKYIIVAMFAIGLSPILSNVSLLLGRTSLSVISEDSFLLLGSARASSLSLLVFIVFIIGWLSLGKIRSSKWSKYLKFSWAATFSAAIIAGGVLLLVPQGSVQDVLSDQTMDARIIVWNSLGPAIQEKPLFGWGPENFDQAFERHFNKDLYTREGALEVWFSKAHNIVLDSLVSLGLMGCLALLLLVGAYMWVVVNSYRHRDISELESVILLAIPFVHFLQLQTGFDTVATFTLLATVGGYVLWLERKRLPTIHINKVQVRVVVVVLALLAVASIATFLMYEYPRQRALVEAVGKGTLEQRVQLTEMGLSRVSDFEGLHRSTNIFLKDLFSSDQSGIPGNDVELLTATYIPLYVAAYERYLERQPEHYRARMNYAYLLIVNSALNGDDLTKAIKIIDGSYILSPENPLTYVVHAMAFVYSDDIPAAEAKTEEAARIFPNVQLVEDASAWVYKQKQQYPNKNFLIISNI